MFSIWVMLFSIAIIGIIGVSANNKYVDDVSDEVLAYLKRKDKRMEQEENIQKRVWVWAVLALFIVVFLSMSLASILFPLGDATGEVFMQIYEKQKWCRIIVLIVGVLGIVARIVYERVAVSYATQYKVPAYVQKIHKNPQQRVRQARVLYYDFVADRVRVKEINAVKIERETGIKEAGDMLSVIVEEGKKKVYFVAANEEMV